MLKEKDLKKHLKIELEKLDANRTKATEACETNATVDSDNNATDTNDTKIITEKMLYNDAQLKTAVDILKALIITSQKGK